MKLIFGLFFSLMSTCAFCQTHNSLIWKISGNNLTKPSFLFGTIHAIPSEDFFIKQEVIDAFLKSEVIVLETGQNMMTNDSIKRNIMLPGGCTLRNLYTKNDYKFLERFIIDTLKGSVEDLITFKPIWLLGVISKRWYKNHVGYESMFITKANENHKIIIGLNEPSDLVGMFNKIPLKEQASIFINTIRDRKIEEFNYQRILQLYLRQDVNQIHRELNNQLKEYPKYYDILFNKRNDKWIHKINEIVRGKSCFIAVGVGHLGGKLGLIAQLEKIGYKIEPL